MNFLKGKKTYITMVVMIVLGGLDSWNAYCSGPEVVSFCTQIQVPSFVFSILATLGIYTRSLANKD
jgi:hypothetical protein